MACSIIQTAKSTKVNGKTTTKPEKEKNSGQLTITEMNITGVFSSEKSMERGYFSGQMGPFTGDNSKMGLWMEWVSISGQMDTAIREIERRIK
jgi:hypothetical protein